MVVCQRETSLQWNMYRQEREEESGREREREGEGKRLIGFVHSGKTYCIISTGSMGIVSKSQSLLFWCSLWISSGERRSKSSVVSKIASSSLGSSSNEGSGCTWSSSTSSTRSPWKRRKSALQRGGIAAATAAFLRVMRNTRGVSTTTVSAVKIGSLNMMMMMIMMMVVVVVGMAMDGKPYGVREGEGKDVKEKGGRNKV